jgi:hypothetical protein
MERISDLSRADRMYAVYMAYGKSMISAHALERLLAAILVAYVCDTTPPGQPRSDGIERIDRMTFGQLLREFVSTHSPTDDLVEELENMLYFRNELAHRMADTITAAAMDKDWEERLVQKLMEWDVMFRETSDLLRPIINGWVEEHKIDFEKVLSAVLKLYPGISTDAEERT